MPGPRAGRTCIRSPVRPCRGGPQDFNTRKRIEFLFKTVKFRQWPWNEEINGVSCVYPKTYGLRCVWPSWGMCCGRRGCGATRGSPEGHVREAPGREPPARL